MRTYWTNSADGAYDDPFNNLLAAPFPVEYFEPDLVVSNLAVPAASTSGETIQVDFTVTNSGTRANANGQMGRSSVLVKRSVA